MPATTSGTEGRGECPAGGAAPVAAVVLPAVGALPAAAAESPVAAVSPGAAAGGRRAAASGAVPSTTDDFSQTNQRDRSAPVVQAIESAEHMGYVLRLRKGMFLGGLLWPAFAITDFIIASEYGARALQSLLTIRFATWPIILLGVLFFYRRRLLSPLAVRVLQIALFTMATFSLALMCVFVGGFSSVYYAGISLTLVCRGAFLGEPWQQGVLHFGLMTSMHPLVLLVSTAFSPAMAAQLSDPRAMSVYTVHTCFLLSTAVLAVVGSHVSWALRRQLFETRSIGRYRLRRRIGAGGMGEVWAAYDKAIRRKVAIKFLRMGTQGSEMAIARFEREVRATSELTHPNTIRVFDCGRTEDGLWYYAMELLRGVDLGTLIRREGALPPARAVRLLTQAARALAEAHAVGIVHRDIKPDNLFVAQVGGETDVIKVLDFGIAKVNQTVDDPQLTSTGALICTPAFASPEVVAGKPADSRSDVYALGAVLYATLSGQPPFTGTSPEMLSAHLGQQPVSLSERMKRPLPAGLEPIVMRCLEKDPDRRFRSAAELAAVLSEVNVRSPGDPQRQATGTAPRRAPLPQAASALAPTIQASLEGEQADEEGRERAT